MNGCPFTRQEDNEAITAYICGHPFYARAGRHFGTSERREFQRDVYDYARSRLISLRGAKEWVSAARKIFVGHEEGIESDEFSGLEGEVDDQWKIKMRLHRKRETPSQTFQRSLGANNPRTTQVTAFDHDTMHQTGKAPCGRERKGSNLDVDADGPHAQASKRKDGIDSQKVVKSQDAKATRSERKAKKAEKKREEKEKAEKKRKKREDEALAVEAPRKSKVEHRQRMESSLAMPDDESVSESTMSCQQQHGGDDQPIIPKTEETKAQRKLQKKARLEAEQHKKRYSKSLEESGHQVNPSNEPFEPKTENEAHENYLKSSERDPHQPQIEPGQSAGERKESTLKNAEVAEMVRGTRDFSNKKQVEVYEHGGMKGASKDMKKDLEYLKEERDYMQDAKDHGNKKKRKTHEDLKKPKKAKRQKTSAKTEDFRPPMIQSA